MSRRVVVGLALGLFLALGGRRMPTAAGVVSASMTSPASAAGLPAATRRGAAIADSGQDIRDIHGPRVMPRRRSPWWYAGAASLAAAAVAGVLLYRRRRPPAAPAHERALRALREAAANFEADPRQFSFAVSEIVRRYVEEAFRVRAAHRTTEELLADLMLDGSPVALHRTALGELLRYCDLAKFAGWSLSPADRAAMLASAETFIGATARPASPDEVRRAALHGEGIA